MAKFKITIKKLFFYFTYIYTYKISSTIMCNQEKIPGLETDTPSDLIVCVSYNPDDGCLGGCGTSTTGITTSDEHTEECPCDEFLKVLPNNYLAVFSVKDEGTPCCSEYMTNYTFQVYGTEEEAITAKAEMDKHYEKTSLYYDSNIYSYSALQNMHNVNDLPDPYT